MSVPEIPQYDMKYIKLSDLFLVLNHVQSELFAGELRSWWPYEIGGHFRADSIYSILYDISHNQSLECVKKERIKIVENLMEILKKHPNIFIQTDI